MFENRSAKDVVEDGERAPLGVVIATVAGTLALGGMLGIVSIGTMNGMRNNAIENVRAQIMAGEASQIEATADDGASGDDGSAQAGHLGTDGKGAVDAQGNPVDGGSEGDAKGTDGSSGVDDVVDSSVSVDGGGSSGGPSSSADAVYDVQWGDTLSDISRRFGVSVDEIATANGIWDPNLIYADSSLKIPRAARGGK